MHWNQHCEDDLQILLMNQNRVKVAVLPFMHIVQAHLSLSSHDMQVWLVVPCDTETSNRHMLKKYSCIRWLTEYYLGKRVTYVVEMRKLNNNWGREGGRGGFDCHWQDLGVEHSAIPGGTPQSQVSVSPRLNQTETGWCRDDVCFKWLFFIRYHHHLKSTERTLFKFGTPALWDAAFNQSKK